MSAGTQPPRRSGRPAMIIATCIPLAAIAFSFSLGPSPEKALARFYQAEGAEDQLMDPLILAGEAVVPLVLAEVSRKDMPRRRYAIAFLGNIASTKALAPLESILRDESEQDYVRADALKSISMIDRARGLHHAAMLEARADLLGTTAKDLRDGRADLSRRSLADALSAHHD